MSLFSFEIPLCNYLTETIILLDGFSSRANINSGYFLR